MYIWYSGNVWFGCRVFVITGQSYVQYMAQLLLCSSNRHAGRELLYSSSPVAVKIEMRQSKKSTPESFMVRVVSFERPSA